MNFLNSKLFIVTCLAATAIVTIGGILLGLKGALAGLGLCVALGIVVVIMRRPWMGVPLIAFALPFERVGSLDLAGFTLRISQVLLGVTLVVTLGYIVAGKIRIKTRGAYVTLLLFCIGAAIALPSSVNLFRGVTSFGFMIFTMALVVLLPTLLDSKEKVFWTLKALLFGAILTSLFGLFQFAGDLAGLPTTITGLRDMYTKEVFGFPRVQSTALEPLYFANYLLLPLCLSIVALFKRERRLVPLSLATLAVGLPVFVLTLSRAAYIGFAVALFLLMIFLFRHFFRPSRIALIVLLVLLTFVAVTYAFSLTGKQEVTVAAFVKQATDLFNGASFFDRVQTIGQSVTLFTTHPFGIGPGNFGPAIAAHPLNEPEGGWLIVNNIYLEVLVEEGFIGLAGFILFVIFILSALLRRLRQNVDPFLSVVIVALFASLCGMMIQYTTFSILYIMHIWFVFGLAAVLLKPLPEKTP